jgi:hypothetical protein
VNSYDQIIVDIFERFHQGKADFEFDRSEFTTAAHRLEIPVPKNVGDIVYSYRYRKSLPQPIIDTQPENLYWLILGAGDARYRFHLGPLLFFKPTPGLLVRKIPDATPEIISQYALTDEQALLAKIRYNRLIDAFLGIVAYSLQSHLRTKIENYGQIEIDELYVGVDTKGEQYIVPVQAKGGTDKLGVIQTIQDTIYCRNQELYKYATPRPVSAQFMANDIIALFELHFDEEAEVVTIIRERHYRLSAAKDIRPSDLESYRLEVD